MRDIAFKSKFALDETPTKAYNCRQLYSIGDSMASVKSRKAKDNTQGKTGTDIPVDGFAIERTRPLHDQVLEEIERLILSGELRPGDHFKENFFSEKWGVSRAPIREACRVLQQAGLVDIIPNRGVLVRKVSLRDVLHLFDIRAALWRLAAQEATLNMAHRHITYLEELIGQMDDVINRNDSDAYLHLNTEFHDAIGMLSHNRPLVRLQRDLFIQARLFRRESLSHDLDMHQRNVDHRMLVDAMRRGDMDEAGRISEAHVLQSKQRFIDSVGATIDPIGGVFSMDEFDDEILNHKKVPQV